MIPSQRTRLDAEGVGESTAPPCDESQVGMALMISTCCLNTTHDVSLMFFRDCASSPNSQLKTSGDGSDGFTCCLIATTGGV